MQLFKVLFIFTTMAIYVNAENKMVEVEESLINKWSTKGYTISLLADKTFIETIHFDLGKESKDVIVKGDWSVMKDTLILRANYSSFIYLISKTKVSKYQFIISEKSLTLKTQKSAFMLLKQ